MIKGTITARPQVFAAAVQWAAKFLAARPSVPIWSGLRLDATEPGKMTITAMNENVWAVATVPIDGDGTGVAVVSGRLLSELSKTFADKPVTITGGEDSLKLAAGRWTGTLPTMSEEDYPDMPASPDAIGSVSGDEFAHAIAESAVATSVDPDKAPSWRSVHMTFDQAEVRLMATDSYRAAGSVAAFDRSDGAAGETALVLSEAMVDVAAGFAGPDEIVVGLSASQISLASPVRSVVMRLMDGKDYPVDDIARLIAQEQPEHAEIKVSDLAGPLKRAALMRDKEGPVAVGFADSLLTIASKADDLHRDGAEEVDIVYAGPEVVLHFNPKYFADALASAPGGVVDLALTEKLGPGGRPGAIVLTVGGTPWRHILMPIKPIRK